MMYFGEGDSSYVVWLLKLSCGARLCCVVRLLNSL